jgi:hypothetical protein
MHPRRVTAKLMRHECSCEEEVAYVATIRSAPSGDVKANAS